MGRLSGALLAIVCIVLAGCTAPADGKQPDDTQPDVFFVHRMVEHGKQATEAAKLVQGRTTNATVIKLGKAIEEATAAETPQLTALAGKWGDKPAGSSESVPGAIKPDKIATLSGATGGEFTSGWLDTMIVHHRGAITIAETELAQGKDAEARALAQKVIDTRQPQLDQMQGMTGG
ncbi:uncharacterized protein (DUF305 family) [Kibdelosporangium banguiense]|uniref:Uncharacterized protein (DUF305 family) n=1 Tax=Kibdelosporangium banguiense TaxID=1365924 RepID=A0ABS4TME7_9PSEU|nr:DUF305 domain-containing protein [Kibdelosporangium banguiense]MBP2325130.1 uncharacterized protein (DUF305 family) [Kibdelosporangium banguiense]